MPPTIGAGRQSCAVLTRQRGEDPVGHAFAHERIIVAELPKPWPRSAADASGASRAVLESVDRLRCLQAEAYRDGGEAGMKARGLDVAFICVAPDPDYSSPGHGRILQCSRPEEPFGAYRSEEFRVPEAETPGLLRALLDRRSTRRWRGGSVAHAGGIRDLLVCTQGSVDPCCGTFGYPLYARLRHLAGSADGALRVWQASHFQYHRFAPVVLDLPESRVWGGLRPEDAGALGLRNGPPAALRSRYIGWGGVQPGYLQAAEREALVREGWGWTAYRTSGRILRLDEAAERARVRLDFSSSDGKTVGSYTATVEVVDRVPGPIGCLHPGERVDAPQYRVLGIERRVRSGKPAADGARSGIPGR